ncbi:HTTM domain-containing protein [Chitinophaga sp. GCM10012297]|uniref:HTTM domain-containing protein n=1 Tax=Chitinophaga chungangae TaxID=2821488 RepID=A0ABS3YJD7_9BACT|nr:HTTM domain-containing protein [Chitinophaga chungangae]MBO9154796.1 HTTM domain-containing protein [Chitinophaga chungangae]
MTGINANRFTRPASIAPLITFRIAFGLLMFASLLRFWWRGWVTDIYVLPQFHFTYQGFEWVRPLGNTGMHALFAVVLLAALFITIGFLYRISAIVFFLGFTYIELIDVTTYLNHYYFISLVAFLMIWLPANRRYAVDTLLRPGNRRTEVPAWCIQVLIFQISAVYVFAGLAKLNADWLLDAQPMRTWLPAKTHLPLAGPFMYKPWVAYLFSWFGAVYDLFIVFFLLNKRTRVYAYGVVLIFHIATAVFFPGIGMFPYVMMTASLIFFSGEFHERLLGFLRGFSMKPEQNSVYRYSKQKIFLAVLGVYVAIQILLPLRFLLYPGHLFWTEEGYRFSWRVMLMEKAGNAYFTVKDQTSRAFFVVNNAEFLTPLQEKMMSTQPDLILKYAHHLAEIYRQRGMQHPEVYGEIYVTLNGRRSRLFVDSTVNLAAQPLGWEHYQWVLPYQK